MALVKLGIHRDYVPKWGLWEGVREFVQNALDEDDKGHALVKTFGGGRLTLRNVGSEIPPSAMAVGFSSKANDASQRGQYGEGMKLAMLALMRLGIKVTVQTGDRKYQPEIVHDDKLACDVLAIRISKRKWADDTVVYLDGIAWQDYAGLMSKFAKTMTGIAPPIKTLYGNVYTDSAMKGKVFVKGIYVCDVENMEFGYDLKQCDLDRDRSLPKQFDVEWYASACVREAVNADELPADVAVAMSRSSRVDGRHLLTVYDTKAYKEKILAAFRKAVPAEAYAGQHEAIDPALPFKVERIPASLSALKDALVSVEELLSASHNKVVRTFAEEELTDEARMALRRFNKVMDGVMVAEFVEFKARVEPMFESGKLSVPHKEFDEGGDVFVRLCENAARACLQASPSMVVTIVSRIASAAPEKATWANLSSNPLDVFHDEF